MKRCRVCGHQRTLFVRTDIRRCISCHLDVYEPRDQRETVFEPAARTPRSAMG